MHAHCRIYAAKVAVVPIIVTSYEAFLCRLEQQLHRAAKPVLVLAQQLCRAKQHRRMAIVPAGMHNAIVLAFEFNPAAFFYRQCVYIRPQQHDLSPVPAAHGAYAARIVVKALHFYAHFLQLIGYIRRGLAFIEG